MIGLEIFMRVAKNLYLFIVSDHHTPFLELVLLTEALNTFLTEAHVLVAQLSMRLEKRAHWATHNDLDLHG